MRWFLQYLEEGASVTALGPALTGPSIAGPRSRDVLAALADADVSAEAFPFMHIRRTHVGLAPCTVGRISFTGDLGYETWMAPEYQRHVYLSLKQAGAEHCIRDFGLRALSALRLEKGWGGWAREYRPVYTPWETGLGRYVALDKEADFIGKAAARAAQEDGPMRLRTFRVEARDSDPIGDEPLWLAGEVVGWVTSGGFAHTSGVSVAMGYVPTEHAETEAGWEVELLGERLPARLLRTPLFDGNGSRMRS